MAALQYTPACLCGKPLRIFKNGKVVKACSPAHYPEILARPKREAAKAKACIDCGAIRDRHAKRCWACYGVTRPKHEARSCEGCGKPFTRSRGGGRDAKRYCSRECAFKNIKAWQTPPDKRKKRPRTKFPYRKVWFKRCAACEAQFTARRLKQNTCSTDCCYAVRLKTQNQNYVPRQPTVRLCITCEVEFVGRGNRLHCSRKCSRRVSKAAEKALRRARESSAMERVNPSRVFERDGWRCQICGKDTPKAARGSMKSNAPELDHRIPLSRGGGHTYANTQCACRACNGVKGNKTDIGQLPLFNQSNTRGRRSKVEMTF